MRPSLAARLFLLLPIFLWAIPASGQSPVVPGFPNVPQTPGAILSGLNEPNQGRTAIIAYHNGILFTLPELPASQPGSDFQVRTWDLSDPTQPAVTGTLGISPMPINAHGYFKSGDYLVVGPNWPPEAPWSFRADGAGAVERTEFPGLMGAGIRGQLFQPWFVGDTYWSYGEVSGNARIEKNWVELASWDHLALTGVVGHPFLLGDLLIFASDQSRTGVATYDVSDPTNPVLLDVLTEGGPGGYWPELWGGDGKLYIVFPYNTGGNGFRVVDATDPTELQFVTDKLLPGDEAMYAQFQDEYAFIGSHKIDMRTLDSVLYLDGANTVRPNDGGTGINTSQFALPLGNLLVTGGIGANQGMAIWAHQAAPDTRGPSVGYHVPRAGQTGYSVGAPISVLIHETLETPTLINGVTFIVRPLGGSPISGRMTYAFDDILTFTPDADLQADTTYEVIFPAGGIKDAAGNGMEGYSFTFSTGSTVGGNRPPEVGSLTASAYPAAPGAAVTLTAAATDPDGDSLEYRFDFGDGSPRTPWSSSTTAVHAYGDRGHYQATAQARDPSGSLASRAATVTVLTAPAGPFPTAGGQIACDASARRVWKVDPDNDSLAAIDADALSLEVEVAVCDDPRGVARTGSGDLWVACHDDDTLRVLNASGDPLASIPTGYGSAPVAVVTSPDGATVYAALSGSGQVRRFDAATRQQTGALDLGPRPRALAVSGDGSRLLVTRLLSPAGHGEVWDVDTAAFTLSRTLRIPKFGGEDNRDTTASGRGVANYLTGIAISPDGQTALVTANKPNSERGLVFAEDLDSDNTVRNLLVRLDLGSGTVAGAVDIDNSDSASSVAYSPLGDYVFITLQGDDDVLVLDALLLDQVTGLGSFVSRLGVGAAPQGVCVDPTTRRTFVANFMGRSVTVLETDGLLRLGNRNVTGPEIATSSTEALAPEVLQGKRLFYHSADPRMSAEGYMSCATCHLDGGHDGRTWDFTGRGEGFRNTTSLRGRAGTGQGNVHWTANFDEIQDFENDIRGAFGGRGFLTDSDFAATSAPLGPAKAGLSADLDALAAYVTSLVRSTVPRSPFRQADGSMTAQALSGQAVFQASACGDCHGGADFTDSTSGAATLRDVGTLRTTSGGRLGGPLPGIDTPTLLGVWNTPPYFHDGSAPTLDDVFRVAGGEVLQAEAGATSGGAQVVDNYVDLNNDDTVHGRAYVRMSNTGARLTLSGVDGGVGGVGAVEVRYSTSQSTPLQVVVNGVTYSTDLASMGNDPGWRHTQWGQARVEGVTFTAGATNTVAVVTPSAFPNVSLDNVLITTADEVALAEPHRRALALSTADRDALVAFLRQLDGRDAENPLAVLFRDGFESGDLNAWSQVRP
ncbi:MAG: Ig-like domain-containing protein [Acidobacteriota bacterium]